jgi:hypothetical protein
MSSIKIALVPVFIAYVDEIKKNNPDFMGNTWCKDCKKEGHKDKPCKTDTSPFKPAEIAEAIKRNDFETIRNEYWGYDGTYNTQGIKNEDLCNRARHIRRIAYLATHCDGRDPIRMMPGCARISDGGHRFVAALYRGASTIQVYVETEQDKQYYKGHLPAEER